MGSGSSYRGTSDRFGDYNSVRSEPLPRRGSSSYRDPHEAQRERELEERERKAYEVEQKRREEERTERVREERERAKKAPSPHERTREQRDTRGLYDRSFVRGKITYPDPGARSITLLMIDNSGSNRIVAEKMRQSSGYILSSMGIILGRSVQLATIYGSDHRDGRGYRQDVDFIYPTEEGDRVMFSTTYHVQEANGDDEAEAFECLLWEACDINFGHLSKEKCHLILATDVVAHGMGLFSDDGCPHGRRWQDSVARVRETFGTFQVIGTSTGTSMGKRQAQFLLPDRVRYDLLDMSEIHSMEHRLGIIPSAALFLMARNEGNQIAQTFLQFLYEKWLSNPIFGQDTDMRAREAIARFFPYIEGMCPQMQGEWEEVIFRD